MLLPHTKTLLSVSKVFLYKGFSGNPIHASVFFDFNHYSVYNWFAQQLWSLMIKKIPIPGIANNLGFHIAKNCAIG